MIRAPVFEVALGTSSSSASPVLCSTRPTSRSSAQPSRQLPKSLGRALRRLVFSQQSAWWAPFAARFALGAISDYIGRRTAFSATVGIFAVFTGLVAASWNVLSLGVFRFFFKLRTRRRRSLSPRRCRPNLALGEFAGVWPAASLQHFRSALRLRRFCHLQSSRHWVGVHCSSLAWCQRRYSYSCAGTCPNPSATW